MRIMTWAVIAAFLIAVLGPVSVFADEVSSDHVRCSSRAAAGFARCHSHVVTDSSGTPATAELPNGYGPAQFHAAYNMPSVSSHPVTIAVVSAYHDPSIASDLRTYDAAFGLSAPPSFQQVSQRGGKDFGPTDPGWALETSMDVEMAHQMCQNCRLLLVEADSPSLANLMAAIDTAVAHGAKVISNSYGAVERSADLNYDRHLRHPGVIMTFSSGDSGYGVSYPATAPSVVAVGGTRLRLDASGHRLSETAWSKAGSGCSQFESKPSWQHDDGCARRAVADLSADADPVTGAAVYDSLAYQGQRGWYVLGGTSLAAPLVAGMYGLGGGASSPATLYAHPAGFNDIVSGHNGRCGNYLCASGSGYDGPTGLGSPNNLKLF